jgi:hypothetical protein
MSSSDRYKTLKPLVGFAAALVGFAVAAVATPVVLGQDADGDQAAHTGGPATARTLIASGETKQFGRWEILSSETADGIPCLGVRLLDSYKPGGSSLSEACGTSVDNQVGSITASDATLFFGRVTGSAEQARISADGQEQIETPTFTGRDGLTYVLAEASERLPNVKVELTTAGQRNLGRVDPAAVNE